MTGARTKITRPTRPRGRPKGSGAGLDAPQIGVRLTRETYAEVEKEAAARGIELAVVIREIVERWAKRRRKEKDLDGHD